MKMESLKLRPNNSQYNSNTYYDGSTREKDQFDTNQKTQKSSKSGDESEREKIIEPEKVKSEPKK